MDAVTSALLQSLGMKATSDAPTPAGISDAIRSFIAPGFLGNIAQADSSQMQQAAPKLASPTQPQPTIPGLIAPGNIDLNHRPVVRNPDGSYSTVRSISIEVDGHEVLIPTVSPDGRVLSDQDAIRLFQQTRQHLGVFDTPDHANAYAESLHNQQAQEYSPPPDLPPTPVARPVPMPVGASPDSDVPQLAQSLGVVPDAAQRYRNYMQGR